MFFSVSCSDKGNSEKKKPDSFQCISRSCGLLVTGPIFLQVSYKLLTVVKFIKHGSCSVHCAYWDIDSPPYRNGKNCKFKWKSSFLKVVGGSHGWWMYENCISSVGNFPQNLDSPQRGRIYFLWLQNGRMLFKALFILKSQRF